MTLRINDMAPDFTAQTTHGEIRFHDWIGEGWAVLFSHPKDFTPVCTTELGYLAGLEQEFARRDCKIIGLSVDAVDTHQDWKKDIRETQGHAVDYPLIADTDLDVSRLYHMLPANESGTASERTAADNATVRTVFVIGPVVSDEHGAQLRRNPARTRVVAADRRTQRRHAGQLAVR